jgi:hypothetical protein
MFFLPVVVTSDNARWRWQWIPLSLQTGMKIEGSLQHSQQKVAADNSPCQNESLYMQSIRTFPFARIKVLSPIFGKLGMYENSCLKTCGQLSLSLGGRAAPISAFLYLKAG